MSRLVVWSRQFVSNLRFQRSFLKTDSCDRALSRAGVSNLRYLQLILKTGSIFVSMLYTTNIETLCFNYFVSTVTFDFFDRDWDKNKSLLFICIKGLMLPYLQVYKSTMITLIGFFFWITHMAGSSQPQHFFAAGCLFADFAIAVIFYPVIKTDIKFES